MEENKMRKTRKYLILAIFCVLVFIALVLFIIIKKDSSYPDEGIYNVTEFARVEHIKNEFEYDELGLYYYKEMATNRTYLIIKQNIKDINVTYALDDNYPEHIRIDISAVPADVSAGEIAFVTFEI